MFCQDWGGLIGLRVVGEIPERFSRIIAGNTGFPAVGGIRGLIMPYHFRYQIWRKGKVTAKELEERINDYLSNPETLRLKLEPMDRIKRKIV